MTDKERRAKEWLFCLVSMKRVSISYKDREQGKIIFSLFDEVERLREENLNLKDGVATIYAELEKLRKVSQEGK